MLHFRRKIPADLIARFGSREVVRSIGRLRGGEARLALARLWTQTELAFMYVRANPDLNRQAIERVFNATVELAEAHIEDAVGAVPPQVADDPFDEPANVAARLAGVSLVARSALDGCAVDAAIPIGKRLGQAALGRHADFDEREGRRLGHSVFEAVAASADRGAGRFAKMAARRPAAPAVFKCLGSGDYEIDEETLALLKTGKVGENVRDLIDLAALDAVCSAGAAERSAAPDTIATGFSTPERSRADSPSRLEGPDGQIAPEPAPESEAADGAFPLVNADLPLSSLWSLYTSHKVAQGEWNREEQVKSTSALRLVLDVVGDKPAAGYTPQDIAKVRETYRQLPAKYAQANPWREIYINSGPAAVVAAAKEVNVDRVSKKSWNSTYSRISGLFEFAKSPQGAALSVRAGNPCKGLFLKEKKERKLTRAQRSDLRREYTTEELETIFRAPTFLGASSESRWSVPGHLIFRNARYWLVIIGATHGTRREEPISAKVKHVKRCPKTGIWYFDFEDPELRELLKADGSPRLVPLHKTLLGLGFLEARIFGRDPDARVFPDAETNAEIGGDGGPFGQWFRRFRCSLGITDDRADYHSFRTTAINLLDDSGVIDPHSEALCGHESRERRSEIDSYKRPKKLQILKAAVDKIDVPIDVEALMAAVARSDLFDRKAAWPDLQAPLKWGRRRSANAQASS